MRIDGYGGRAGNHQFDDERHVKGVMTDDVLASLLTHKDLEQEQNVSLNRRCIVLDNQLGQRVRNPERWGWQYMCFKFGTDETDD